MASSGIHRLQVAKLTLKQKRGKALVKALGEHFAPTEVLRVNSSINNKNSSGGALKSRKNFK